MPTNPAPEPVSTADIARQAVNRLQVDARGAVAAMIEVQHIAHELQSQLQELLAYLDSRAPRDEDGIFDAGYYESQYECPAYADAADRLRTILGIEK